MISKMRSQSPVISGKFLTILLASAVAVFAPVQTNAETLGEAISHTLSQHPQIDSATAALRSAEQAEKEQFSAYFPTVNASAQAGRLYGDNATSRGLSVTRGAGYSNLGEGSISANQMIFDGFETKNRVDAARADIKSSALSLRDVQENLAFQTVETYVNLMRVQRGLELLRTQGKSAKDYLSRITSMVEDGAADEAELQQARDVTIILDNFLADYEGQARTLASNYHELTGRMPEGGLETPVMPENQIPADMQAAIEMAKDHHPLLKSLQYQSQASKLSAEAEKAPYYPSVDGELSYLKSDKEDILGGEIVDARAVLRMNWAFETGGAQKARIKQRTYDYKQARAQAAETERQIENAIMQAYAEMDTAKRQLKNQKERQELNEKLLETYKVQFEGARVSVLQLMQADNQVLLTKLESLNAQSRVLLARYGILSAMGKLSEGLNVEMADANLRRDH